LKFHLSNTGTRNAFTGYGDGYVLVNGLRYEQSVVVVPDRPVEVWKLSALELLDEASITDLATLGAEILLVGTGRQLRFPDRRILRTFVGAGIGVEFMDTMAACRTYNILLGEDRAVAAALIV
jgi:uncharacterized protein